MSLNEQELYLKDLFLVAAAVVGLIIILFVHFKNFKLRMRPIGRRKSDLEDYLARSPKLTHESLQNWTSADLQVQFKINLKQPSVIWYVSLFYVKNISKTKAKDREVGKFLYKFSNSPQSACKIVAPIFLKAQAKYKNAFFSYAPIDETKSTNMTASFPLYTWLKSKSQIRTAVFQFLNETSYIAKELNLPTKTILTLDEDIKCEVTLAIHESLQFLPTQMTSVHGVECIEEKDVLRLILWIAFAQHRIPPCCVVPEENALRPQNQSPWAS